MVHSILPHHQNMPITPRVMEFEFSKLTNKLFFDNNSLKTCFMAALSATFPPGESEFIESIRLFRDKVNNPQLSKQITGFIGQEAHHGLQHKRINQRLKSLGFDAPALEQILAGIIKQRISRLSPKARLAITVSMEHLTAILAEHVLATPAVFDGLQQPVLDLMMWHAVEEIEHKSVAFDAYMECVGDREFLHKVMKVAIWVFLWRMTCFTVRLMWWNKMLPSWLDIRGFYRFMFAKQGLIRSLRPAYNAYFQQDFHPWHTNSVGLVEAWKLSVGRDHSAGR